MLNLLIGCLICAPAPQSADVSKNTRDFDPAIAKVFDTLVRINVTMTEPSSGRLVKQRGTGSGVIISQEGHVVTNHHVAGRAEHIVCDMTDGEQIEADLLG